MCDFITALTAGR